jgi:hypothetical protein
MQLMGNDPPNTCLAQKTSRRETSRNTLTFKDCWGSLINHVPSFHRGQFLLNFPLSKSTSLKHGLKHTKGIDSEYQLC